MRINSFRWKLTHDEKAVFLAVIIGDHAQMRIGPHIGTRISIRPFVFTFIEVEVELLDLEALMLVLKIIELYRCHRVHRRGIAVAGR